MAPISGAGRPSALVVGPGTPSVPKPSGSDVARLVADKERARYLPGQLVVIAMLAGVVELDDADAVREMVDHPDLAVRPGRDGDRLQAHRNGGGVEEPTFADAEDLEAVVRR